MSSVRFGLPTCPFTSEVRQAIRRNFLCETCLLGKIGPPGKYLLNLDLVRPQLLRQPMSEDNHQAVQIVREGCCKNWKYTEETEIWTGGPIEPTVAELTTSG
jgi:hypothetical protein